MRQASVVRVFQKNGPRILTQGPHKGTGLSHKLK